MATYTFERTAALIFIDKMLEALSKRPMTRAEMEVELFASKTKMLNYIRLLHGGTGEAKRIYIVSYDERETGGRNPRYAVGDKLDAPPLGSKTMAQRHRLRKANPDKHRRYLAKLRAAAAAKRSRAKPTTWLTALGI
jgi:hypothetical protein